MTNLVAFNPVLTTNAAGTFNIESTGFIQGMAMDDPATRFALAGGILDPTEVLPMWGGVGISNYVAPASLLVSAPQPSLGGYVKRATNLTANDANSLTGFSVFDQAHHMINTPQSPVPLSLANMSVHFYALGSRARIAVQCDPSLVGLDGGIVTPLVSWDFTTSVLQPYAASDANRTITTATWANTNGGELTLVMGEAIPASGVGNYITISGATNSGTGGAAAINKTFVISEYTDTTHFKLAAPAAAGVFNVIAGTPVVVLGIGALPVRVLEVQQGNCMVVGYDPVTGYATWNRDGSCALIQI